MFEPQVTVLHVDDNEANRYVVNRILQNGGFQVLQAATGTAGLKSVIEHLPDLVILDVKLPDLNGFEVCRQIKSNPKTAFIPVLHLSASFVKSQDKAEGLDSGADAYLAQPVEPIELLATVRSLLRVRQAEEAALTSAREWQNTFDAINDSVGLLDREGKILRCNGTMMQLFGKAPSELLGRAHHELMKAELGVGDGICFNHAKETHCRQVLELQSNSRWFAKTMDPIVDEQGRFTGAVFILSDITERKRAEAMLQDQNEYLNVLMTSLQQQTEQAQQANRIKDEFLAVLSHELRSPLNPILGWAKLLREGKLNADKTALALETIERNAQLQTQLIADLLDVSRILQGKTSLTITPVNLAATIAAALETVWLAAEAKSIQVQTNFDPAIDLSVLGDATRLQQVVWNLLSNAVKFTPSVGRIDVYLEVAGTQAQIRVQDTGKGIDPAFLPHVFEYFRQADATTTRKFGGLGLGLAIVHHLVELHGGTVQAMSPGEEQGATFIVSLPLLKNNCHQQTNKSVTASASPSELSGVRVLVVDDAADTRDFFAFVLEQAGATVHTAASAVDALQVIEQSVPDILLSDIGMPDMNGYMLLQQLRALTPAQGGQIPAIALTAYAGEINHQAAIAAGFQQHLAKPIEPTALIAAIAALLDKAN